MNKSEFIKELSNKTGMEETKCNQVNEILEGTFLVGKKNKDKMIEEFKEKLNMNEEEANKIYNTSMEIIAGELKEKIKHPFKNQD